MSILRNASTQTAVSASGTNHDLSALIEGRNEIGDLLLLNMAPDATATTNAVTGWTELRDASAQAVGQVILYRIATAKDEVLPEIVLSAANALSVRYLVISGVNQSTPIGNTAYANGASTTPTWSTIDYSAYSTVLFLASLDGGGRTISALSKGIPLGAATGSGTGGEFAAKFFSKTSGSTGSVTATMSANDGWQCATIEILDDGNQTIPAQFSNTPAESLGLTTHATDNTWRDRLTTAQVDPRDGASIANTKTFDAATNVDTTLDTITITGHGYKTGTVVKADANGNTLPTGITDGAYYFIHVVDANTIKLMLQNAAITVNSANTAGAYYDDDTTPATIDITATGSGTCRFINSTFMFVGFNSADTIIRENIAVACFHNFHCVPIKFASPLDMSAVRLATNITTATGSTGGNYFLTVMDSDGDYKTWKISATGKSLTTATNVFIRPDNTKHVYEYGTFNSAAVEYIILMFKGNADDSRMGGGTTWALSTSQLIRKAAVFGGTSGRPVTWSDVVTELQLYTTKTSSINSLASSQVRLSHVIQLGDGTNQLIFNDDAKALSFDPASDGVISLTRYYTQNGILLYPSADDSITASNELIASDANFDWLLDASSSASATVAISSTIFSKAAPVMRAQDTYSACTFTGCSQIDTNGAALTNCVVVSPDVAAGEAAVLIESNGSQTGLTIDVTGTSTPYHLAFGTSVDTYTLTDTVFTGTPGTNKIHVKKTSGTFTLTASGTTSLVEGDITSDGADVVLVSGASVTISGLVAGSEVRAYVGTPASNTLLDNTESSGTSFTFSHTETGNAGFITIRKADYVFLKIELTYAGTDTTIPVQQQADRVYANPA